MQGILVAYNQAFSMTGTVKHRKEAGLGDYLRIFAGLGNAGEYARSNTSSLQQIRKDLVNGLVFKEHAYGSIVAAIGAIVGLSVQALVFDHSVLKMSAFRAWSLMFYW